MNDDWMTIDAVAAEKFVEESIKVLTGVTRFFKERELTNVLKISQSIKSQIDEFKPKVPLLVSLRKQGMNDRHWGEISKRVGFPVKPSEGFTFTKVLEMGLLDHVDVCVEVGEKAAKEYMIETMLDQM